MSAAALGRAWATACIDMAASRSGLARSSSTKVTRRLSVKLIVLDEDASTSGGESFGVLCLVIPGSTWKRHKNRRCPGLSDFAHGRRPCPTNDKICCGIDIKHRAFILDGLIVQGPIDPMVAEEFPITIANNMSNREVISVSESSGRINHWPD